MAKSKRRHAAPPPRPRADHGTAGPAMAARPSVVVETVEAGTTVRWMEDTGPIAHYRRGGLLLDRQCDALARLAEFYEDSGRRGAVSGGYGSRVGGFGQMSDRQAKAWKDYCGLLDKAPPETRHAIALVAEGTFPTMANHLYLIRRGASALADRLQLNY